MPRGDGTGPTGKGPRTGRGLGTSGGGTQQDATTRRGGVLGFFRRGGKQGTGRGRGGGQGRGMGRGGNK